MEFTYIHYSLSFIIILLIVLVIYFATKQNKQNTCSPCIQNYNIEDVKNKLTNQLFELNLSYKGPLLSFSKKLITVKNYELIIQDDSSFAQKDIWFYDSISRKLQHLDSGMYIKTNVAGDVTLVSMRSESTDFIYNKGSFQDITQSNCLSIISNKITLAECGYTPSLFFTGQNGQFSFDNKKWFSEPELVTLFV